MTTEEAFNKAYDDYADALFRHCMFRLSHRERALELVQETFMKAWDTAQKGEKVKNWRALLYKYLNNLIIDEYRKKKQHSLEYLLDQDGVNEGTFDELNAGSLNAEIKRVDTELEAIALHNALGKLQDNYRRVIILRYIDGLKVKEVSKILHESQNVVSVRINRALKKLEKALRDAGHDIQIA
jgi:RNA polymerase sigma-70 factor (ECF subfamily)